MPFKKRLNKILESYEGLEDDNTLSEKDLDICDACDRTFEKDSAKVSPQLFQIYRNLTEKLFPGEYSFEDYSFCCNNCLKASIEGCKVMLKNNLGKKGLSEDMYDGLEDESTIVGDDEEEMYLCDACGVEYLQTPIISTDLWDAYDDLASTIKGDGSHFEGVDGDFCSEECIIYAIKKFREMISKGIKLKYDQPLRLW